MPVKMKANRNVKQIEIKKMRYQQIHIKRNTKRSFSDNVIPVGRTVMQKIIESTRNGKCKTKSK